MVDHSEIYREIRKHGQFIQEYSKAKDPNFEELNRVDKDLTKRLQELCMNSILTHDEDTEWNLITLGTEIEEDLSLIRRGLPPKRRDEGYSHIYD